MRVRRVERRTGERKGQRIGDGHERRSRACRGDASGIEVDADPAGWKEPTFAAAHVENAAASAPAHQVVRPADGISVVHPASVRSERATLSA
jgi:hypothetical protein